MATELETATVNVGGLNAYLARPEGGSAAGMLLLPMVTGIGEQVREFARDIAGTGVTTLTWDLWHGRSTDDTPREELMAEQRSLDDERCLAEQAALLEHLFGELGCARVGVIGWCLGGRFALLLGAREPRLACVVAYHPTVPGETPPNHVLDAVEHAGRVTAPVMMHYPGADSLVPHGNFLRLRDALDARDAAPSIVGIYPHAEHGFSDRSRHGNPVNANAYALSWPQTLEFIRATTC